MEPAIVYTTPTCPWCRRVKEYLSAQGVPYRDVDVSRDQQAAQDMVRRTGQMGVPVTVLDGEAVVGFDKPRLEALLAARAKRAAEPAPTGAAGDKPSFGVAVKAVPGGLLVGKVRPGTRAAAADLRPGDVIVTAGGHSVAAVQDLTAALTDDPSIPLTIQRDGKNMLVQAGR